MSQRFDELSKALASGMSRRQALWRFGAGIVGAALATLMPWRAQPAAADGSLLCLAFCRQRFPAGLLRDACIVASRACPPGQCAGHLEDLGINLNGINLNGINLNGINLNGINLNGINLNGFVIRVCCPVVSESGQLVCEF
jgi:uncharacterized protein YjbI with pentapeptide repeats